MLNVIMLNVVMLNVIILSVIVLRVIILSVVILNVVAPLKIGLTTKERKRKGGKTGQKIAIKKK